MPSPYPLLFLMKNIFFAALALTFWAACQSSPTTPAVSTAPPPPSAFDTVAEKTAVTLAVRGFFDWYSKYMQTPEFGNEKYNFVDYETPHPVLKPATLDAYLQQFVKGGFVGQAFVDYHKSFYQKAAIMWQKEEKGDVPSGMDADPYFCAQDDVAEYYLKADVDVQFTAPGKATAVLKLTDLTMDMTLPVYLQKENGKWLYVRTECDLGVQ